VKSRIDAAVHKKKLLLVFYLDGQDTFTGEVKGADGLKAGMVK